MGYAMPDQTTSGIHTRLRSRVFIVDDGGKRVVFISNDICFTSEALKVTVVDRLQAIFGNMYTHANVMISGTHTHAGPGGYSWYAATSTPLLTCRHPMYDISTLGFQEKSFEVIVS